MTDATRRAAVLKVINAKTADAVRTRAKARAALVAEGIYTHDGVLREQYRDRKKTLAV